MIFFYRAHVKKLNGRQRENRHIMPKKIPPENPFEIPVPGKNPEIKPGVDPEYPEFPEEEPDIIPEDDPREIPPPYEIPPPGEAFEQNSSWRE